MTDIDRYRDIHTSIEGEQKIQREREMDGLTEGETHIGWCRSRGREGGREGLTEGGDTYRLV